MILYFTILASSPLIMFLAPSVGRHSQDMQVHISSFVSYISLSVAAVFILFSALLPPPYYSVGHARVGGTLAVVCVCTFDR